MVAPLPTAPGGPFADSAWRTAGDLPSDLLGDVAYGLSHILLLGLEVLQCLLDPVREVLGQRVLGRVGVTLRSGGGESKPDRDECERRLHLCSF